MTTCPPASALARFASGELDEVAAEHARACVTCRGLLEEQRDVRALAAGLAPPALSRSHRAALAAEVMARSDLAAPPDDEDIALPVRSRASFAIAGFAAVAAIAAILLSRGEREQPVAPAPPAPVAIAPPPVAPPAPRTIESASPPPAAPPKATVRGATADFAWRGSDEIVHLRDGALAVDAVDARPVQIVAGETRVAVARARADVKARRGVIQTVTVIAGSVEVVAAGKRHVIEAGMTWERPSEAKPVAPPPIDAPALALAAFRDGWTALREGRHRDAIAAFDRATDPVVAEDAAYWAAVATERAGDREAAADRFAAFAARFPHSPRATTASATADRLRAPSR